MKLVLLILVISGIVAFAQDNLPVLIGDLGSFSENDKNWRKINKQVRRYVRTDRFASRIKTADLKEKEIKHILIHKDREFWENYLRRNISENIEHKIFRGTILNFSRESIIW